MRSRSFLFTIVAMSLLTGLALAADVSGKWVYSMPTRDGGTREGSLTLKAGGATVTGSVTGMRGNIQEITNGKIDGDTLTFDVKAQFQDNTVVMHYKGVVAGGEIKFSVQREGADRAREFTAKRAK
jgi:hypothetical protein